MIKISDVWTFDEFAQSVENQRKCWDENTFNEYVNEFGPITEKVALDMFDTAEEIWTDMRGW